MLTLKEGFEGEMTEKTIELAVVTVPKPEDLEIKSGERIKPVFRKLTEREIKGLFPFSFVSQEPVERD